MLAILKVDSSSDVKLESDSDSSIKLAMSQCWSSFLSAVSSRSAGQSAVMVAKFPTARIDSRDRI